MVASGRVSSSTTSMAMAKNSSRVTGASGRKNQVSPICSPTKISRSARAMAALWAGLPAMSEYVTLVSGF